MTVKTIAGIDVITGQTEDDLKRAARDGFVAIRDDAGHLLMRYNPEKNLVEIKRRDSITVIDLDRYRRQVEYEKVTAMLEGGYNFWKMMTERNQESAMSAANEGGAYGRRINE